MILLLLACAPEPDTTYSAPTEPTLVDSGDSDSGDADPVDTDSADTDTGDTGSGDTGSGDTDSAQTDTADSGEDTSATDSGEPEWIGTYYGTPSLGTASQREAFCRSYDRIDGDLRTYLGVTGLECLVEVTGDVVLDEYTASVSGLDGLTTIGGDLISYSTGLVDFSGMGSLSHVGGDISLQCFGSTRFTDFNGLDSFTSFTGSLTFTDCHPQSLEGLDRVAVSAVTMNTNFYTGSLGSFEGLNGAAFSGSITADEDFAVDSLVGLEAVTELEDLVIEGAGPSSADGLESLRTVRGDIYLDAFVAEDLDALSALVEVGGDLTLASSGCASDGCSTDGGPARLGLTSLQSVGGDLTLIGIRRVSDLSDLAALVSVGGTLSVRQCDLDVAGLDALVSVEASTCGRRLALWTSIRACGTATLTEPAVLRA